MTVSVTTVAADGQLTVIRRPMVVALTAVMSALMGTAGVELIVWTPFRYSQVFQPARAVTARWSMILHLHSLDLWGIGCFLPALGLWTIFTRRWWLIGWCSAGLGMFVTTFFGYTFLEEVTAPGRARPVPAPSQQHGGLFIATFMIATALIFALIVFATLHEHRTLRKGSA